MARRDGGSFPIGCSNDVFYREEVKEEPISDECIRNKSNMVRFIKEVFNPLIEGLSESRKDGIKWDDSIILKQLIQHKEGKTPHIEEMEEKMNSFFKIFLQSDP